MFFEMMSDVLRDRVILLFTILKAFALMPCACNLVLNQFSNSLKSAGESASL